MHLWLAHTRHPCKCKHPLSTLKPIWLYMHRGNHTHLEAFVCVYNAQLFHLFWELHLNVHFTRIQTSLWFCINRIVAMLLRNSMDKIELVEDLKTILIYDIQLVSTKASLRDIPMCFACGRRAKLWIEIFFFLQIQKVIAYTNEKLIFQAFHYHSQGNGKRWVIVREWYFCYLGIDYIDVVVCCRHFFSECCKK